MRFHQILFMSVLVIAAIAWQRNWKPVESANLSNPSIATSEIETKDHVAALTTSKSGREIASVSAASTQDRLEVIGTDEIGMTLRPLLKQANDGDTAELEKTLAQLDKDPSKARKVIDEGLSRLPRLPSHAIERAGLLDLSLRYKAGNEDWAENLLVNELVNVPAQARPLESAAASQADLDKALTVTPDIMRIDIAFNDYINLRPRDCGDMSKTVDQILASQSDELLKANMRTRLSGLCPSQN